MNRSVASRWNWSGLKKNLPPSVNDKRGLIEPDHPVLSVRLNKTQIRIFLRVIRITCFACARDKAGHVALRYSQRIRRDIPSKNVSISVLSFDVIPSSLISTSVTPSSGHKMFWTIPSTQPHDVPCYQGWMRSRTVSLCYGAVGSSCLNSFLKRRARARFGRGKGSNLLAVPMPLAYTQPYRPTCSSLYAPCHASLCLVRL